jgi:hypothetical protein
MLHSYIAARLHGEVSMMPVIRVDDDVFGALQKRAVPLVDTPNSVLRRLLELDKSGERRARVSSIRAPRDVRVAPSSLVSIDRLHGERYAAKPKKLRLPTGEERELGSWGSLLVEVAQHLVRIGKLTPERCPIQYPGASKRYLVHTQARHPSGKNFFQPSEVGAGLSVETGENCPDLVNRTRFLLEHFGEDASQYGVGS